MKYVNYILFVTVLFSTINDGLSIRAIEFRPHDFVNNYSIDSYLQNVVYIQSLSSESAIIRLKEIASDDSQSYKIYVLCRLLFKGHIGNAFRSPRIGMPGFLGDADNKNWPLDPVGIIDGVPFLVVDGYSLFGLAESPADYLRYCLENCEWNDYKYEIKTRMQKENALKKMLSASKWSRKLDKYESKFLTDQVL